MIKILLDLKYVDHISNNMKILTYDLCMRFLNFPTICMRVKILTCSELV